MKGRSAAFSAFLPIALLGWTFLSCASLHKKAEDAKPAPSAAPEDLPALAEKDPQRTIALARLLEDEGAGTRQTADAARAARVRLEAVFSERVEKREWREALGAFRDLAVSSSATEQPPEKTSAASGWTEAALMEELAASIAAQEDPGRALLWYEKAFALAEPDPGTVGKAWKLALDSDNRSAQRALLAYAKKAGIAGAGEIDALSRSKPPFKEMVKGVCTIWVNRGLKVEGGVAVPDRVIGSGFFIDKRGYLLTNYHVISSEVDPEYEGYSRLFIRLSGMKEERIPAKVIGWDRNLDLALLKASATPDFVFSLSPGREFSPGDRIYAIGSPVGLENTITSGIVSATGRQVLALGEALQVDVAVNPGNSGGPLLDENGDVAGIVFAGLSNFQGLNFAIPADWVAAALDKLYAGGEAGYAFAGISILQDEDDLRIVYPLYGSPARDYDLRSGDILLAIDGRRFKDAIAASAYVLSRDPGNLATLEIQRDGKNLSVILPLAKRPFRPLEAAIGKDPKERLFAPLFGMETETISKGIFGTTYRIVKVYKGQIADEAGLSVDDPFSLQGWKYDKEKKILVMEIYVKRRKQGFLETIIQIPASIEGVPFL